MITYELAEELRDAGWPQPKGCFQKRDSKGNLISGGVCDTSSPSYEKFVQEYLDDGYEPSLAHPTLSELIEACGKTIPKNHLYDDVYDKYDAYITVGATTDGWRAGYMRFYPYEGEDMEMEKLAPTPEEAVARLWLALNKKT